jgi:hypothetical protein
MLHLFDVKQGFSAWARFLPDRPLCQYLWSSVRERSNALPRSEFIAERWGLPATGIRSMTFLAWRRQCIIDVPLVTVKHAKEDDFHDNQTTVLMFYYHSVATYGSAAEVKVSPEYLEGKWVL